MFSQFCYFRQPPKIDLQRKTEKDNRIQPTSESTLECFLMLNPKECFTCSKVRHLYVLLFRVAFKMVFLVFHTSCFTPKASSSFGIYHIRIFTMKACTRQYCKNLTKFDTFKIMLCCLGDFFLS